MAGAVGIVPTMELSVSDGYLEMREQETRVIGELGRLIQSCGLTFDKWSSFDCTVEQQQYFPSARMRCLQLLAAHGSVLVIKRAVLDHLLLILSFDPYQDLTANELPRFIKEFVAHLENIENEIPTVQSKFARIYGSAIDNMVCHNCKGTLGVIREETKKTLQHAPTILERLNKTRKDPDIEFAVQYALEGAKLLETDSTKADKLLRAGIAIFQTGISVYKGDFGEALSTLRGLLGECDIQAKWFQASLVLKKLTQPACLSREAFEMLKELIVKAQGEKGVLGASKVNWKYLYAGMSSLKEVVLHAHDSRIQTEAMELLLFYPTFNEFQYKGTNWKVRYGACLVLEEIWREANGSIQQMASQALLEAKATEKETRIQSVLVAITEDSTIRQSWRFHI